MNLRDLRIASALLESPDGGMIELTGDWTGRGQPRLRLAEPPHVFASVQPVSESQFGLEAGFFVHRRAQQLHFVFDPARHPGFAGEKTEVFVAGSFNGWQEAVGREEWRMRPGEIDGRAVLLWTGPVAGLLTESPQWFKFVSGEHHWFDVPASASNVITDELHHRNYVLTAHRTGAHRFSFRLAAPLDLSLPHAVVLTVGGQDHRTDLQPGRFFFELHTDRPLGAIVGDGVTTFRLFAPRASEVRVAYFREPSAAGGELTWHELERLGDGAWELAVREDLHGAFYWFRVDGPSGKFSGFDPAVNILDPWALAAVGRDGPGIVLDPRRLAIAKSYFRAPQWQDLVIVEGHVRDLLAHSPILTDPLDRQTFAGLVKWVEHRNCYVKKLGANALELQPVQQCNAAQRDDYQWGYMPVNYFAPEATYGRDPARASQVVELQQVVETSHRQGLAVILDVVYNHYGEPNHLYRIDKLYYFHTTSEGVLDNWSGCGNDLRTSAAMVRRLVIESLVHLVTYYGVDGFRFDLAELVGLPLLREIETALKRVRPDVILIAEPWSFRGNIAADLRETGFASWNDGFRNFLRDYVRDNGGRDAAAYFLRGSPWHFARWPSQTINYTESHDDRTWIDTITENPEANGLAPTANDIRRTHLMAAFMMASIGIPMVSAGQDFLRSKAGVNNTYLRGDLNAIDYRRMYRYPGTHAYFAAWIRFRLGRWGRMFRHYTRPEDGFLEIRFPPEGNALAAVYNANGSLGPMRVLFAINPHRHDVAIPLREFVALSWQQVADHEHFFPPGEADGDLFEGDTLVVPELGCGVWIAGG